MNYLNLIKQQYFTILPKLELISVAISLILLIGIVYILFKFNYATEKVDLWKDASRASTLFSQKRVMRGWRKVLRLLRSKKSADWRLALIEVDKILGEVLRLADYQGANLEEQLKNISKDQLSSIEELRETHQLIKQLKQDPDFSLSKETADETAYIYGKTFRELRLLK